MASWFYVSCLSNDSWSIVWQSLFRWSMTAITLLLTVYTLKTFEATTVQPLKSDDDDDETHSSKRFADNVGEEFMSLLSQNMSQGLLKLIFSLNRSKHREGLWLGQLITVWDGTLNDKTDELIDGLKRLTEAHKSPREPVISMDVYWNISSLSMSKFQPLRCSHWLLSFERNR